VKLEIKKIGNSTGLILPKEFEQGDAVVVTETPSGFSVSRDDPTLAKGLKIARKAMKTYRNALKELAK
jgi:putative addiction module antidote